MKKLIVLSMVLLLAAAAVWADTTVNGEVETRWLNDYTNKLFTESPEVVLGVNATVDDYNKLYIEIEEKPNTGFIAPAAVTFNFDKAYFTTDLGAIFDLPVGVTWRTGFDEYDPYDAAKVTWGEWEDVIGGDLNAWGEQIDISKDMVNVRLAWGNDFGAKQFLAGASVKVDPVYVEVSYVTNGEDMGMGSIFPGLEVSMDVADGINVAAAVTAEYDLDTGAGDSLWGAGAGVLLTYNSMVSVGAAWRGVQDLVAGGVQIDLWAKPSADQPLEIFVALGIGLEDTVYPETFDSLEASLKYMFGASTWYLGVQWIADGGVGIASEKGDFGPETTNSTSLFMRAELKY